MSEKTRYGLIGDSGVVIAPEIDVEPIPLTSNGSDGLDGRLIDGQTAQPDKEQLTAWLQSGLPLVISNGTPQLLESIGDITGCGTPAPASLVAFTRQPGS